MPKCSNPESQANVLGASGELSVFVGEVREKKTNQLQSQTLGT